MTTITFRSANVTDTHVTTPEDRAALLGRIGQASDWSIDVAKYVLRDNVHTDWTVRAAIPTAINAWVGADAPVTEDVDGKRVRTSYGKGVDAVTFQVRKILAAGKVHGPEVEPVDAGDAGTDADDDDDALEAGASDAADYLALAVQAAAAALANGHDAADILAAVAGVLA